MSQPEKPKTLTTQSLGQAICDHFGLSIDRVSSDYEITHAAGLMSLNLTVFLTADDLAGIARKAGAKLAPMDKLAFVDAGKDELVVVPSNDEPGPELINVNASSGLGKAFEEVFSQIFQPTEERLNPKAGPAKPHDSAPDPRMEEVLAELKALRCAVDALSKKLAPAGHYPGNALRKSMVLGSRA